MEFVKNIIAGDALLVENELERCTSEEYIGSGKLQDAMKYSVLGGGKRIRGVLTLEFAKLFGGDVENALAPAASVEMVHAYSLIHDDLPCMDDDDIRRGKPSCHIAFGEATALLAGDTLLTYAMENGASAKNVSDFAARRIVATLAYLAGSMGMAGGQQIDLDCSSDTYEKLKKLHSMKTGALIKAAALMGYYSVLKSPCEIDNNIISDISEYCECIGLAFQIKDDLLDLEGDAKVLGKAVGIDEKNGRVNALTFFTPDEAREECKRLSDNARNVISKYEGSEFLAALPEYLNNRNK